MWAERHAWEFDHIVPLADGGTHELSNMQTLCRPCHRAKTAREAGEGTATAGGIGDVRRDESIGIYSRSFRSDHALRATTALDLPSRRDFPEFYTLAE
jgi:hypothetical protein